MNLHTIVLPYADLKAPLYSYQYGFRGPLDTRVRRAISEQYPGRTLSTVTVVLFKGLEKVFEMIWNDPVVPPYDGTSIDLDRADWEVHA